LDFNQISTIASGTFGELTALQSLYGMGLWAWWTLLLAAWCLHECELVRAF
jgi:hypothetical protein